MQPSHYRTPRELERTPSPPLRTVIVGSCFASTWPRIFMEDEPGSQCEFYLFNNATILPDALPSDAGYDFQVVQLPIRTILPDHAYFAVGESEQAFEALLAQTLDRFKLFLANAMKWNAEHGLLTFVANFMVPQQNPLGRLLPRYDLRNMVHFVERVNRALADEVATYQNAYLLDVDQIAATYGRRYVQDDVLWQFNHGSTLSNADFNKDAQRLEPVEKATDVFDIRNRDYVALIWAELRAMYRTVHPQDPVKLVVVDIDDTLWRGVAAERTEHDNEYIEGWPLGVVDALKYLKRRGVLLAIASRNDETRVSGIWKALFRNRIGFEDFVSRKINWRSKVENFEEILAETNLLPKNVLFIDDNPVEWESILKAFPGVRVLGGSPYQWRRILLWAAETQVATITAESSRRTTMVQAQIEREQQRGQLSRGEFLESLSLRISIRCLDGIADPAFDRALELVNKTNQFNTTGRRWTLQELGGRMDAGARVFIFDASDNYTDYGIVGVIVVDQREIVQFVMSCRVAGMEVESAALSKVLVSMAAQGIDEVSARYLDTGLNMLCRDFFRTTGFEFRDGAWRHSMANFNIPSHVDVEFIERDADGSQAPAASHPATIAS